MIIKEIFDCIDVCAECKNSYSKYELKFQTINICLCEDCFRQTRIAMNGTILTPIKVYQSLRSYLGTDKLTKDYKEMI